MGSLLARVLFPVVAAPCALLGACGGREAPPSAAGAPRHVVVFGTPYEMGEQHGRALRAEIAEALGPRFAASLRSSAPDAGSPEFLERTLRAYAREMKGHLAETVREELRGLAAGSGQSEDDLFLLDVVREGLRWHGTEPRALEGAFASPPAAEGTTFGVVAYQGFVPDALEGRLVVLERRAGEASTVVLAWAGSLGALAGASPRLWAAQAEVGYDVRRGSLKGPPFAVGFRVALERATGLDDFWERLPRLSGNRVLAGAAGAEPERRLGVVAYAGDDPTRHAAVEWVLAPAGAGGAEAAGTRAQDERLGAYPRRPGAGEAAALALAGRREDARGPVVAVGPRRIEWWGTPEAAFDLRADGDAAPSAFRR
jgi:hypothetical protein